MGEKDGKEAGEEEEEREEREGEEENKEEEEEEMEEKQVEEEEAEEEEEGEKDGKEEEEGKVRETLYKIIRKNTHTSMKGGVSESVKPPWKGTLGIEAFGALLKGTSAGLKSLNLQPSIS